MAVIKTDKEFEKLEKLMDKLVDQNMEEITDNYKETLDTFRNEARQLYDKYAVKGQISFADMQKFDRIDKLKVVITQEVNKLYKNNDKLVKSLLNQVYEDSFNFSKSTVESAAKRKVRGVIKDDIVKQTINMPLDGLTLDDRLSRDKSVTDAKIRQTFQKAFSEGDSYSKLSKDLQKNLEISANQANTIARTEGHRIMEAGKYDPMQNAANQSIEIEKVWRTSKDEKVRNTVKVSHVAMDNQTVEFDENFVSPKTGGTGIYPGQLGTAADDVNCRCIALYNIIR